MKLKLPLAAAAFFAGTSLLSAAPLTAATAVHTKPDDAAPAITVLKAGAEPPAATDATASAPAGWLAVDLPGPFTGYVRNGDIMKNLDVRPGASIYLDPKADAGVLATMVAGDKTTITGLLDKWTQVRLDKKLTGYIRVGPAPGVTPAAAAAPVAAPAPAVNAPGKPVPVADTGGALPRQFQGKFVSTRSPFHPRRPYDWQLEDDAGKPFAFLDVSKLLLTEQIEDYVGHTVAVTGTPKPGPDGKGLVIEVESLQLQ